MQHANKSLASQLITWDQRSVMPVSGLGFFVAYSQAQFNTVQNIFSLKKIRLRLRCLFWLALRTQFLRLVFQVDLLSNSRLLMEKLGISVATVFRIMCRILNRHISSYKYRLKLKSRYIHALKISDYPKVTKDAWVLKFEHFQFTLKFFCQVT